MGILYNVGKTKCQFCFFVLADMSQQFSRYELLKSNIVRHLWLNSCTLIKAEVESDSHDESRYKLDYIISYVRAVTLHIFLLYYVEGVGN